jgi:hypothetical protein
MHLKSLKKNRKTSTCNRMDLETLGSPPILPKNLPEDDQQGHAGEVVRGVRNCRRVPWRIVQVRCRHIPHSKYCSRYLDRFQEGGPPRTWVDTLKPCCFQFSYAVVDLGFRSKVDLANSDNPKDAPSLSPGPSTLSSPPQLLNALVVHAVSATLPLPVKAVAHITMLVHVVQNFH